MSFTDSNKKHIQSVKELLQETLQARLKCNAKISQIGHNCILSGGAIPSLLLGETPNDYDLLFNFPPDLALIMNDVVSKKYQVIPEDYIKDISENYHNQKTTKKCVTDWAVTLSNDLQFIFKTASYRKGFDFIHNMPYYDIMKNKLYISKRQYDLIVTKCIEINPNHSQPISQKRIDKYLDRDWRLSDASEEYYNKNRVVIP